MADAFESALNAEYVRFHMEDHASALISDPPVEIIGLRTNGKLSGKLYQTKEKKILVAVFLGILCRNPPAFGRIFVFSLGEPGTTVKVETPIDMSGGTATAIKSSITDRGVEDGTAYHALFLKTLAQELQFDEGFIVPALNGKSYACSPAESPGKAEQVGEKECMVCLDAEPQTMVLPCLHRVVCEECSRKLKNFPDKWTCLYCRQTISGVSYDSGETELF